LLTIIHRWSGNFGELLLFMKCCSTRLGKAACCAALVVSLFAPGRVGASAFVYQFTDVFEGSSPEGTSPWLTTSFSDVSPGVVQLTISAAGMTTAEDVGSLLLNFNPAENPGKLSFAYVSSIGSFAHPTISTGENKFKANGDGKYDIDLAFSQKNGKIFTTGDSITFDITSSTYGTGLNAQDFDYLSQPSAGGAGPFLAALQLDCTSSSTTEWAAPTGLTPVPEPGTISLFVAGGALLAASLWRKSRRERSARTQ
jgi:hypothetical protein